MLANRVSEIKASATLAIAAEASAMKKSGVDVISLSTGEPDFDTPSHIKNAAIDAINAGFTKYTPTDGFVSLKEAVQQKFAKENFLQYQLNEIIVSSGAKQAIYNLCQAILNKNDEAIIPAPYWVSYPEIVKLAEAKPKIIPTTFENNFKITPKQLKNSIDKATKLFFLNSPSNPAGVVYSEKELLALAEVLLAAPNVFIISDDIYEHIIWKKNSFKNIVNVCPELKNRTLIINGVSKAYAMTGWRIGYAAGDARIISVMKKIQSQSTSNPCSIAQIAAEAALRGNQNCIQEMRTQYKIRHDLVLNLLKKIPDIEVASGDGAFYLFPNMQKIIARLPNIENDIDLCKFLLEKAKVALVPGTEFGFPGFIRISYATDIPTLEKALNRLATALFHQS